MTISTDRFTPMTKPDTYKVTTEIPADRQEEFMLMLNQFHTGETDHAAPIRQRAADREQGIASLKKLVEVAQGNSGQCRYVARFLAGVYNGPRFPIHLFSLTDLRAIDADLFEHCMSVLRMDSRPAKEVHTYFPNGSTLWEDMIKRWGLDQEQLEDAAQRLASYLEYEGKDSEQKALGRQLERLFKK